MEIRSYRHSDFKDVIHILEETGIRVPEVDTQERFRQKIEKSPGSIIIAEKDGEIVGTVFVTDDATTVLVTRLGVLPDHRGEGIGTSLLEKAEEFLDENDTALSVALAESDDEELRRWYHDRGYETSGKYDMMIKNL